MSSVTGSLLGLDGLVSVYCEWIGQDICLSVLVYHAGHENIVRYMCSVKLMFGFLLSWDDLSCLSWTNITEIDNDILEILWCCRYAPVNVY